MRFTFDMRPSTEPGTTLSLSKGRKRLGRKRAGHVGECVRERWSPVTKRATCCRPA